MKLHSDQLADLLEDKDKEMEDLGFKFKMLERKVSRLMKSIEMKSQI